MKPFVRALAAALVLTGASTFSSNAAVAVFPKVTGQNLNGKTFNLPGDFKAPASFVYIAYVRGQQTQIDTWKAVVSEARERYPSIGEYELPTLSKGNAIFRGFIDGGMRNGIRDSATRDVTITLYIDKRPFNESLGIASEDTITILLVNPGGSILWRATGPYEPTKATGLDAALGALG